MGMELVIFKPEDIVSNVLLQLAKLDVGQPPVLEGNKILGFNARSDITQTFGMRLQLRS